MSSPAMEGWLVGTGGRAGSGGSTGTAGDGGGCFTDGSARPGGLDGSLHRRSAS